MAMKAFNNWILVDKAKNVKEEKIGSISIINSDEEAQQNMGIVVSVGRDCDCDLQPGDTVVWGDWQGAKVYWNKKKYTAIRNTDVIIGGCPE